MTAEPILIGGRYELAEPLGRGGMAEVRSALDRRLGRQVAVKQLRADLAMDPTFQARFRREAQSAAGLNHPNIVAVYETGEELDPATGVSVPYIVMELVEGTTLRDVLREERRILPERALELTAGVLDALSYSHRAGIVHRDIKPANVMLTPTGAVKVMDFGIARAVADTSATMTQTAAVIGTAQYLSPEQARGETVDARSDLYSTGCLLYELLVGRPPFLGDSPVSVAYQHVRELPVPPSQLDPAISASIDAITLRALAKGADDRYQSAREMKEDITRVLAGQQPTAVVPKVVDDPGPTRVVPAAVLAAAVPEDDDLEDEPRRSRLGAGLLVAALLLVLLGAGAFALYRAMEPAATPPPAEVQVPSVITFNQEQATGILTDRDLKVKVARRNGNLETKDTVVAQNPLPETVVPVRTTVTITVNVGPETAEIPANLVDRDLDVVRKRLADAGFTNVKAEPATTEPIAAKKDQVLSVQPGEGEPAALDEQITITYATGKSRVPVLTEATVDRARDIAREAGFSNLRVVERESSEPAGLVIKQNPDAGELVSRDTRLTLTVAVPKEPEPAPTTNPPKPTKSPTKTAEPTKTPDPSPTPTPTGEEESPSPSPTPSPTPTPTG